MKKSQRLELRASEIRQRLNEISGVEGDDLTDEIRSEADTLQSEYRDVETRRRAAIVAEAEEEREAAEEDGIVLDSEMRERLDLRGKARLTDFVLAALRGRRLDGASAEYAEAEGAGGDIPVSLFEPDPRDTGTEERATTGAPGTVGVNMAPIQPAVFAPSIAASMGIDMPSVASGTFGQARINVSLTAAAKAKGADTEATAATFAVATATPKRISAALEFVAEDVASAGVSNFEAALRENLSMALSAELDDQFINGDGQGNNLQGLFAAIGAATPDDKLLDFGEGVGKLADLVDGLFATEVSQVRQIVGLDTYRLASRTVTQAATGEVTLAEYLRRVSAGFSTNERMPAIAPAKKQSGLAYRTGRSGMRTAVSPHWGRIGITDMYSGAGRAETRVIFHVLLGDVLVIQPKAYAHTQYQVLA